MSKSLLTFSILWLNAYLPPLLWAALIFLVSSQGILPGLTEVWSDFILKKTAHMFVYAVLYLLMFRGVQLTFPLLKGDLQWMVPVFLCFGYAASDELHQMYVPGRYGTIRDVGFDMLGVGIAFLRQYRYI